MTASSRRPDGGQAYRSGDAPANLEMPDPIVILGSGLAGYNAARELRRHDADVPLVILTADDGRACYKPDLSEAFAKGRSAEALASAGPEEMATKLAAEVRPRTVVAAIDPAAAAVRLAGGGTVSYGRLVLAVGADPATPAFPGDAGETVYAVNDLEGYARFRRALETARSVAVIGAGLVGCEFANDLSTGGLTVDVVDPAPIPLARFLPPAVGEALRDGLAAAAGVRWHLERSVDRIERLGAGSRVVLDDGRSVDADVVLAAVGLRPRTALAAAAGLEADRAVVTDRYLRTSAHGVFALGDCAEVEGHLLPFVLPLMQAARALGRTLAGELTAVRYPAVPVVAKTHAYPVSAVPPPQGLAGEWRVTEEDGGLRALFHDASGALRGFALSGGLVKQTGKLARELPPVLAEP